MKTLKSILNITAKPALKYYLRKKRGYRYKDVSIEVFPGVFHPGLFFSTKVLLSYLEKLDLKNKRVLELGAGTGLISIVAARKGASVTATDISRKAMDNITVNAQLNKVNVELYHSNLFQEIPRTVFDYIIVNPPYFKGDASNDAEMAWYAGAQFEYFHNLFLEVPSYINDKTRLLMILADSCDILKIQSIGKEHRYGFHEVYATKVLWERNYIFELKN